MCAHVKCNNFSGKMHIGGPSCALGVRPKLICSFGIATIGRKNRDFPSRVLSTCGTGRRRTQILVVGNFGQLDKPTMVSAPSRTKFSLRRSPNITCRCGVSLYKTRANFSHSRTKGRKGKDLNCDKGRLRKVGVTKGAFSCPFMRNGTVRTTKGCDFMSYDSRTIRGKHVRPRRCPVISFVLKLRGSSVLDGPTHGACCGAFSSPVRQVLATCYRSKKGLLIDKSCVNDSVDGSRNGQRFARGVLGCNFRNSLGSAHSKRVAKLKHALRVPHLPGRGTCTMATPSYVIPMSSTFPMFICRPKRCDTKVTCGKGCQMFTVKFPFRDVRDRASHTVMVTTVLGFFKRGWVSRSALPGPSK